MRTWFIGCLVCLLCFPPAAFAKRKAVHHGDAVLGVEFVGLKHKGSFTAMVVAIQNTGAADATFECCEAFLENGAGYAVPALTHDEMMVVIHNKAKTAAAIGALIGAGLGIVGAVSGSDELIYAATGVGVASGVAGVVGEASAAHEQRNVVIDNIMRARSFPAGLKIAGVVYFPPRKKWPDSNLTRAIHLTYKLNGRESRVTVPIAGQ